MAYAIWVAIAQFGVKQYPPYMNRPRDSFRPEHGVIAVPAGTELQFSGVAGQDLASAVLMQDEQVVAELAIAPVTDDTDLSARGKPRSISGKLLVPERPAKSSMLLRFVLTDTQDITNPRGAAYSLRIDPDRPPAVSMTRHGVRGEISAKAMVPLALQGRDDCGVAALAVTATPMRATVEGVPTTQPAPKEEPVTGFKAGEPEARAEHIVDLKDMGLKIGDRLRLQALARDTLPESFGGPNTSRSVVQTFKIVSDEEIDEELVRRQKEYREELAQAILLEADIRARMRAVGDALATAAPDVETARRLKELAKDQRRVGAQCAVVSQQMWGIREELRLNRVGTVANLDTLDGIVTDLTEHAKKSMPELAAGMLAASNNKDRVALRHYAVTAAGALDMLIQDLERILKEIAEDENRRELVLRLKGIIILTSDIHKIIGGAQEDETKGVLDDKKKKDNKQP